MNKDKQLGEGSSGIVYEIIRIRDSMKMAVKRIYLTPFDSIRDQRIVTQLKTEIQTMPKVRHENIISLEDYFIIGNHCYLIMELATGGSLDEEIKRTGPLSEPKAKNDFIQMVNAINHLHNEHSIAH
jgi:serine/threonine protein kinase